MTPSTLIIANPASGRGRAPAAARRALEALRARGWPADLRTTSRAGEAGELARVGSFDRVLVAGGDGTVGEVAGALAHSGRALGILPAGRGNDFAAALGIPRQVDRAMTVFLDGTIRTVDLGRANDRLFCTVTGVGFDGHVNERVATGVWRLLGALAYSVGVLVYLPGWPAPVFTLEGSFGRVERRGWLVAVSNTGRYGGGIRIVPDARPDDGLLDACLVGHTSRWTLLRLLPTAFRGGHVHHPAVALYRAEHLTLDADRPVAVVVDGEAAGTTPVRFAVERAALQVVTPA